MNRFWVESSLGELDWQTVFAVWDAAAVFPFGEVTVCQSSCLGVAQFGRARALGA